MSVLPETKDTTKLFTTSSKHCVTICDPVTVKGMALFSGKEVAITFRPMSERSGVFFERIDLPGAPQLEATIDSLKGTPRTTIIGNDDFTIQCVEHVLSAVSCLKIDSLIIEINGGEPPIFDGSAKVFVDALVRAGTKETFCTKKVYHLNTPLHVKQDDMDIIALPSESLKYSYTLAYPGHPLLNAQYYSFDPQVESYTEVIAPCRTFATLSEVQVLIEKKIINSDNPEGGVIIDGDKVLNKDGLRFTNEMVRHKILDMIGDLSLIGNDVIAHFIAIKSGHYLNTQLAIRLKTMIEEMA